MEENKVTYKTNKLPERTEKIWVQEDLPANANHQDQQPSWRLLVNQPTQTLFCCFLLQ